MQGTRCKLAAERNAVGQRFFQSKAGIGISFHLFADGTCMTVDESLDLLPHFPEVQLCRFRGLVELLELMK